VQPGLICVAPAGGLKRNPRRLAVVAMVGSITERACTLSFSPGAGSRGRLELPAGAPIVSRWPWLNAEFAAN
jgi:hypothetical protein